MTKSPNPIKPRKNQRERRASDSTVILGRRLALVRKRTGMTQKELAERIGWNPSQVGRIEAGYHELTVKTLMSYMRGVGITGIDFGDLL